MRRCLYVVYCTNKDHLRTMQRKGNRKDKMASKWFEIDFQHECFDLPWSRFSIKFERTR